MNDGQRTRRIGIPEWSSSDVERLKNRVFDARRGRGDYELGATGGGDQYIGLSQRLAGLRAVLRADRNTIQRDQCQRLRDIVIEELQVQDGIGRGVGDSPELLLTRLHLYDARGITGRRCLDIRNRHIVQGQVPGGNGATRCRGPRHVLVANDEDTFGEAGDRGFEIRDTADDNGPRCSALHGGLGNTVDVRVIPVHPGRFVGRKMQGVLKALAGIDDRVNHLVTVARGRSVRAVVMDVQRGDGHRRITTSIRRIGDNLGRRSRRRCGHLVGDGDIQRVTGQNVESGSFKTIGSGETEQSATIGIHGGEVVKSHVEHAV